MHIELLDSVRVRVCVYSGLSIVCQRFNVFYLWHNDSKNKTKVLRK